MDRIVVQGGRPLSGTIPIAGAKNACLPLMPATLLTEEPLTLTNVPRLSDIVTMGRLLESLGVEVSPMRDGKVMALSSHALTGHLADYEIVRQMRASNLVLGPLLARAGHAVVSLPGGCAIGARPMDIHVTALEAMGAKIGISNERERGGEPIADLQIESAALSGVVIDEALIPNLIDELPILAVAATQAEGRTLVRGAGDLRNKESDRIDAVCVNLRALGASVEEFDDGFAITGPTKLTGTTVSSYHDHRIAMSMGVAGLMASGETTVENSECVAISFPGFWDELEKMSIA